MANLVELSEIAVAYPGRIPIDVFIKNSGLTNKDEIAEQVRQQDAAMMAMQPQA
jgi:short-subunit dehydrogenase